MIHDNKKEQGYNNFLFIMKNSILFLLNESSVTDLFNSKSHRQKRNIFSHGFQISSEHQ
jgi:hypothetical protein